MKPFFITALLLVACFFIKKSLAQNPRFVKEDVTSEAVRSPHVENQAQYFSEKKPAASSLAESIDWQKRYEAEHEIRLAAEQKTVELEVASTQNFKISWAIFLTLGVAMKTIIGLLYISRKRTQARLLESEVARQTLENQQMQENMDAKQADLTTMSLEIARRNQVAREIHGRVQQLEATHGRTLNGQLRDLSNLTAHQMGVKPEFQELLTNVDSVNSQFYGLLSAQFPELSPRERELCGLLRLNLPTKDIAAMYSISPKSIEMNRYRLRKKLGLEPESDLVTFLQKL